MCAGQILSCALLSPPLVVHILCDSLYSWVLWNIAKITGYKWWHVLTVTHHIKYEYSSFWSVFLLYLFLRCKLPFSRLPKIRDPFSKELQEAKDGLWITANENWSPHSYNHKEMTSANSLSELERSFITWATEETTSLANILFTALWSLSIEST